MMRVVDTAAFENVSVVVILAYLALLVAQTLRLDPGTMAGLEAADNVFLALFTLEVPNL